MMWVIKTICCFDERRILEIPLFIFPWFFESSLPWILLILVLSASGYSLYLYLLWRDRLHRKILDRMVREKTEDLVEEKQQLWESYLKIENQNQEKRILIQEVHHRVKNNLQTISSLIGMQLMAMVSEEGKIALQETYRRINAMSLVHEMLYSSDSLSHISSRNFFEVLTSSSLAMYNQNPFKIEFTSEVVEIDMEVSTCLSLGMIISEAISNCMKHAFEGIDHPTIRLNLLYADRPGWLSLAIKDNGCGIPYEYINGKKGSIGMRLQSIFARQLDASFKVENSEGTTISLKFKINNHEDSNR